MRLFTGLELDPQVCESISRLTTTLKPLARLKWSPPENFHITTKFIGEWPAARVAEVSERLPVSLAAPVISVNGVGFFPNDRFPKVFFARVEASANLTLLAARTDEALRELGIPAEKHPYRPHVTMARIPESVRLHGLVDRLEELKPAAFGDFRPAEFALFESRAGRYTKLETFPFYPSEL